MLALNLLLQMLISSTSVGVARKSCSSSAGKASNESIDKGMVNIARDIMLVMLCIRLLNNSFKQRQLPPSDSIWRLDRFGYGKVVVVLISHYSDPVINPDKFALFPPAIL
jgi:hypothetical protein